MHNNARYCKVHSETYWCILSLTPQCTRGQVSGGEVEEVAKLLNNAPATATIPSTGRYNPASTHQHRPPTNKLNLCKNLTMLIINRFRHCHDQASIFFHSHFTKTSSSLQYIGLSSIQRINEDRSLQQCLQNQLVC